MIKTIRTNLLDLLAHKRMTKKTFCEKMGFTRAHLDHLLNESTRFNEETIERMGNVFEVPLDCLFRENCVQQIGPSEEMRKISRILKVPGARESLIAEVYRIEKAYKEELSQFNGTMEVLATNL